MWAEDDKAWSYSRWCYDKPVFYPLSRPEQGGRFFLGGYVRLYVYKDGKQLKVWVQVKRQQRSEEGIKA